MPEHKFYATIRALRDGGVEFILVGGLAAILSGAPVDTFDVDIVQSREPGNVERLLAVLNSLDAIFRIQPERKIRPTASYLSGPGHLNFVTRYGPVDVLGTIGDDLSYEDLLPHSREVDIGGGLMVRVLDLETLIKTKEHAGGEKDRLVLPILRRTLEEKKKLGQ